MTERKGSLITHDAPEVRKYLKRQYPPGTIREPETPDPELAARVRAGQKNLDQLLGENSGIQILTATDYAVTINARG